MRAGGGDSLAREHAREDVTLVLTAHQKQHLPCERGKRQRHARHEQGKAGFLDTDDPAFSFTKRGRAGKKRGSMSVTAEPHEHEIEQRCAGSRSSRP